MNNERTVQIYEEERKALRFVAETGSSHIYDLLTSVRTIYINASSLSVSEGFRRGNNFDEPTPLQLTPRRLIRGFGTLCDKSVSVIGDPENKTNRIALLIRTCSADEHAEAIKQIQPDGIHDRDTLVPTHCDAILGFTTADQEIGNKDEWWLELSVAEQTIESLADAIFNKRARSLRIGVGLRNIYTDAGPGALYFGEPVNLFLRPSIGEGIVRRPEVAFGHLKNWSLKFSGNVELSEPFENELTPTPEADSPAEPNGPSGADRTLAALRRLTVGIGSLRTNMLWLAWVLVVLIVSVLTR